MDTKMTSTRASVGLTVALIKEIGWAKIGDEAMAYLTNWPFALTLKDQTRLSVMNDDEGARAFRLLITRVIPAAGERLRGVAESAPREFGKGDMQAMELVIRDESARLLAGKTSKEWRALPESERLVFGPTPYC